MKRYPSKFNVSDINGTNGFNFINDLTYDIFFGYTTSNLGDINADGKSDFMVSSSSSNRAYILFGAESFPANVYTSQLNGTNGFMIIAESGSGTVGCGAAGIGDINGDGIDDLSVGDCKILNAYVVFGAKGFPPRVSLANLNGQNGFKLVGNIETGFDNADALGDVNGDGLNDFGISIVDPNNELAAFVVYGARNYPSILDISTLNGNNGFIIKGLAANTAEAFIAGLGDFNGDGKADFSVGMGYANQAVVIFGKEQFPAVFSVLGLNGTTGFTIAGEYLDQAIVAGIGDFNGDGIPDLGLGEPDNALAYIVFGGKHFAPTIYVDNLNGTNGVKLVGPSGSNFGYIRNAGQVNHNGKSGVIVGAPRPTSDVFEGKAYVFFGSDKFPAELSTSELDGTNGFEIVGPVMSDVGYLSTGLNNFLGNEEPVLVLGGVFANKTYVIFPDEI